MRQCTETSVRAAPSLHPRTGAGKAPGVEVIHRSEFSAEAEEERPRGQDMSHAAT